MTTVLVEGVNTQHAAEITSVPAGLQVNTRVEAKDSRSYHPGNWVALNLYDEPTEATKIPSLLDNDNVIGIQVRHFWGNWK